MTTEERYKNVIEWFGVNMPTPTTELHYTDHYQLLVAVILSAQCTDRRVNMVTPPFFEVFPDAASLASASESEVFELIKSVSYPNNKTRNLLGMARKLTEEFGGKVPDDMDSLLSLPGVGRKTANVILSVAFGKAAMAVDTHVFRVSERIGLTNGSRSPLETERTLTANIPPEILGRAHHWLILHGRYVCKARRPDCLECGISRWCNFYNQSVSTRANDTD